MDTPIDVRGCPAFVELLLNADVSVREFEDVCWCLNSCRTALGIPPVVAAPRAAEFFKAIAEGDRAGADTLLRRWGVRR